MKTHHIQLFVDYHELATTLDVLSEQNFKVVFIVEVTTPNTVGINLARATPLGPRCLMVLASRSTPEPGPVSNSVSPNRPTAPEFVQITVH